MKKTLKLFFLISIFLLSGCGVQSADKVLKELEKKLENANTYYAEGVMEIINHALEYVKEDPDRGDLLHAVLEQTYFTTRKPRNREEILIALSRRGFDMSMASYHIYLKQAIRAIDRILWGYTARDCMDIIKQFLPEQ